jgi:hypothetical protein
VLGFRQDIPCSPGCRLLIGPARRSPAGGVLLAAWCCRPRLAAKAASARGFSDSSGPLALHASGRIDSAAGLRRLLHGREAGTTAGGALALGRVRFCLFHVRSQMTVFLPPSLQTEAHDLKDLGNPGRANIYRRSRAKTFIAQLFAAYLFPGGNRLLLPQTKRPQRRWRSRIGAAGG